MFELALGCLRSAFGTLSWSAAQRLGRGVGRLGWRLKSRDRQRVLTHLTIAFPELAARERQARGRASFEHLGACLGETLHLFHRPPTEVLRWVEVEGWQEVEAARRQGRPIVILTAHCGHWELLSSTNLSHGLGLLALARELEDPVLASAIVDFRQRLGTVTVGRGSRRATSEMLRALRSGGAMALLIDQDIHAESVWVPFFGKLAHTPVAAASLALRLGATVVPAFAHRRADGTHQVIFHPRLELPPEPCAATAVMTHCIEEQIRRYPEQWVWHHRRWRRRPPEESVAAQPSSG